MASGGVILAIFDKLENICIDLLKILGGRSEMYSADVFMSLIRTGVFSIPNDLFHLNT